MRTGLSWLDVKLGLRMLRRYPGLTIVGTIAMAFAIAAGAGVFEFLNQATNPRIPLEDGDRIVGIRLRHTASRNIERLAPFDFATWRREVRTVESLGAFRTIDRNLLSTGGRLEPIRIAEISASGFKVARVAALLGRTLVDADEEAGAVPVVVLGYDIWQSRFGGNPAIVGQSVRLDTTPAAVVGVMPDGFRFPVSHDAWIPFKDAEGSEVLVFGRLARDSGMDEAQAELTTIGLRLAAEFPDTHAFLRPEVLPYAQSIRDIGGLAAAALLSINLFLVMLLVLVCGNVALLMFARAATRESEIIVRTALGAGRGRIIGQLFAESLMLATLSAPLGLAAAGFLLRWWLTVAEINAGGRLPFWFTGSLAPSTVIYAVGLTLIGAIVSGVVPAVEVTGRRVEERLRQASTGTGGLRFGGVWTAVIVAQVALTLAFPACVFLLRRSVVELQTQDAGFPTAQYLSARLELDREERPEFVSRARRTYEEIERRVGGERNVSAVTFTSRLPRTVQPRRWLELDETSVAIPATDRGHRVDTVAVAVNYFSTLSARAVSGRVFQPSDVNSTARPVIVNESFVRHVLEGRNALGRRVRYLDDRWREAATTAVTQEPWHEIVGVVPDLGTTHNETQGALYHPIAPGTALPAHLVVRVLGDPATFAARLRVIAADVDPTMRLYDVLPLSQVGGETWNEFDFLWRLLLMMSSLAILLSLTGIYAAVSFAVSRRRREIGIRIALGARPRSIVMPVLRLPLSQVGFGVIAGTGLVLALVEAVVSSGLSLGGVALVAAYAALMMGVCLLACVVPMARALRVEPTEALRVDR